MSGLEPRAAADRLEADARVFRALLEGVSPEQARWKPAPEQWSALEVVNHLADEEAEDFRRRLDLTLHRPGEPWPAIDPPAWAVERRYLERELGPSLERFLGERERSLSWLRGLKSPDWELAYHHPRSGKVRAGDLLASWLAHDLIHVRQLTRLHHQWLTLRAEPYSAAYAGPF